jgi:hypothetical protein
MEETAMGSHDDKACAAFEAALRAIGGSHLRLEQVVEAFQVAFPAATMQADMRQQLHDAILHLSQSGVLTLSTETHDDNHTISLPSSVEMSANIYYHDLVSNSVN